MRLDFNAIEELTLDVTMKDDEKTELHITAPSQKLVARLKATAGQLKKIFDKKDEAALRKVWELTAELMSQNIEEITITATDLQEKYRMNEKALLVFLQYYIKFIGEINAAKN